MAITAFYVIKGGMFSVVITEVIQFFILSTAVDHPRHHRHDEGVARDAARGSSPRAGTTRSSAGSSTSTGRSLMPSVNAKIAADGYSIFGFFFMMLLFKGFLVSAAGPAPNYDMQRILSTRSPRKPR